MVTKVSKVPAQHTWVAMTMSPVARLEDELGNSVFVDSLDPEDGPQTTYGCNRCFIPAASLEALEECTPDD
jgi:hypothetical protein